MFLGCAKALIWILFFMILSQCDFLIARTIDSQDVAADEDTRISTIFNSMKNQLKNIFWTNGDDSQSDSESSTDKRVGNDAHQNPTEINNLEHLLPAFDDTLATSHPSLPENVFGDYSTNFEQKTNPNDVDFIHKREEVYSGGDLKVIEREQKQDGAPGTQLDFEISDFNEAIPDCDIPPYDNFVATPAPTIQEEVDEEKNYVNPEEDVRNLELKAVSKNVNKSRLDDNKDEDNEIVTVGSARISLKAAYMDDSFLTKLAEFRQTLKAIAREESPNPESVFLEVLEKFTSSLKDQFGNFFEKEVNNENVEKEFIGRNIESFKKNSEKSSDINDDGKRSSVTHEELEKPPKSIIGDKDQDLEPDFKNVMNNLKSILETSLDDNDGKLRNERYSTLETVNSRHKRELLETGTIINGEDNEKELLDTDPGSNRENDIEPTDPDSVEKLKNKSEKFLEKAKRLMDATVRLEHILLEIEITNEEIENTRKKVDYLKKYGKKTEEDL